MPLIAFKDTLVRFYLLGMFGTRRLLGVRWTRMRQLRRQRHLPEVRRPRNSVTEGQHG